MYLTASLHRALQRDPDATWTTFKGRTTTVADHAVRVARLAGALGNLGISDGERVGLWALNSDRFAEALFAVPWAGGVLNPLNTRWSPPEAQYALEDSGTRVLLVDDVFAPAATELRKSCPALKTVVHMSDGCAVPGAVSYEELIEGTRPVEDQRRGGDAVAGIFYTGGTTALPKGVVLTHANLLTSALGSHATAPTVQAGGRVLHVAPMFHLAGLSCWVAQSMVGGTHVMLPTFDPGEVLATIDEQQITTALLVPTMIQMVLAHPAIAERALTSLRVVLYGASPIAPTTLRTAMERFPSASFVQAYGMTELSPVATILSPDDHGDERLLASAGRAALHAEVAVVDPDGADLPPGSVGEVVVRGPHVMVGYWNKPAETEEALRGGWMHTGDAGYMDERGYLYIVDRIKDMIITGGENVYCAEVEAAIAQHPSVAQCAVIGVPDDTWGERVHAVVVLKPGADPDPEGVEKLARTLIASYKVPRSFEFRDALPLSAAGKVLKRDLRAPHWEGANRGVH
ncbi:MAG TPA: long-chain-fatty-acid--CoA ligase [Acidimicrobiales bacterium]|nr:long-chain-fatty-acid--CoA ligase [Acidimicrobiales bacterium]